MLRISGRTEDLSLTCPHVRAMDSEDGLDPGCSNPIAGGDSAVTSSLMPDLVMGLITVRDAGRRPADQGAGVGPYVAELAATIHNRGDAIAEETTTRFWVRGADIDRELRVVYPPALLPGDEIEVTALWDVRDRLGEYVITVTADAFSQIEELRKDNNSGSVHVAVRGTRVDPV
jgi:hypothetical protein